MMSATPKARAPRTTRRPASKPADEVWCDVEWREEDDGTLTASHGDMRLSVVPTFLEDGTPYRYRWRIKETGLPMPDNVITNHETDLDRCKDDCLRALAGVLSRLKMIEVGQPPKSVERKKRN